jgi:LAO/AO transport system kinase
MTFVASGSAGDRESALIAEFDAGHKAALARAVSIVETQRSGFDRLLARFQTRLGRARRLGLTGPPGAGKSTLTSRLVRAYRDAGLTVGVIAVDPTSPFTGGALLGDRIRMEPVALDPGVFIRSMATRGSLGGLSAATRDVCDVLDAFGIDRILIETVGVGQTELDIARTADTSAVILVPESGDSIQTLKAGLMEIADVFIVNKADRPGADRLRNELELMLGLRSGATLKNVPAHPGRAARALARSDGDGWMPPVLLTAASNGEGIGDVVTALDRHFAFLESSGDLAQRRRARLRDRVRDVVESRVRSRLWTDVATNDWLESRLAELEAGSTNPFDVADQLLARSANVLTSS